MTTTARTLQYLGRARAGLVAMAAAWILLATGQAAAAFAHGSLALVAGLSLYAAVGERQGVPLADLQAPKVDPATLNSKQVTDLMTAAGLL